MWLAQSLEARRTIGDSYSEPTDIPAVTVTRCGEFHAFDGTTNVSRSECVVSMETESTLDSKVIVECGKETTYPVGWTYVNGGRGGVGETAYAYVYLRVDSSEPGEQLEDPLGTLVECDEVLEWDFSPGTVHETHRALSVAYLPVANPTPVTITRCGRYGFESVGGSNSDTCVSTRAVGFTEQSEVYVWCEQKRTGWLTDTRGYERIYYRVD